MGKKACGFYDASEGNAYFNLKRTTSFIRTPTHFLAWVAEAKYLKMLQVINQAIFPLLITRKTNYKNILQKNSFQTSFKIEN